MSTPQTVKAQIQSLIASANETTGKTDADLTSAIGSLVEGYSVGVDYLSYAKQVMFADFDIFDTEEVVLNLDNATSLYVLFQNAPNTKVKSITVNCKNKVSDTRYAFGSNTEDTVLETIILNVDMSNVTRSDYMFQRKKALKEILGNPLNLSSVTNNTGMFTTCNNLQEVRFVAETIKLSISFAQSPLLSDESIQSIIDGLADMTGQNAQTLTLQGQVKAKLTEEQIATITSKNWTLA